MMIVCTIIIHSCGYTHIEKDIPLLKNLDHVLFQENLGITKESRTIQILTKKSEEKRYLIIENPHINKIYIKGANQINLFETGDHRPFDQRPFDHRFFIFPINLANENQNFQLTLDKSGENLSYTLRFLDVNDFENYLKFDAIIIGSIIGFYGLAILLGLSLAIYYRNSAKYIYFFLYISFSLVWILNDGGILYEFIWSNSPHWHKSSRGFFSSSTMILFVLYLNKNDNKMLTKGIKSIILILIGLLLIKFSLVFVVSKGLFPDSLKYITMHLNAFALLSLMGYVLIYLLLHLKINKKDLFEILAVITYCLFVIHLSAKELGFSVLNTAIIHHFDAMLFFPVQCLFMSVHLYKKEKERKQETEKALIEYKIQQKKLLDKKVLETEENEKKRIAQNIHDEIGSVFVAMKYQVLSLKEKSGSVIDNNDLNSIIRLSEEGIKKQYSIIEDLLFEFKSGKGLKETLQNHIDMIVTREDISSTFIFHTDEKIWNDFQKTQTFRIVLELLTNTIKHAKADNIKLSIQGAEKISIEYSDNGIGFDRNSVIEGRGLSNINMRVNALNGEIRFDSSNKRTTYLINFDLTHA